MGISQKSIGLFDDDSDIVGLLEEWLSEFFVHVEGHTSIQLPLLQRYDLAVVDWHMQHRADLCLYLQTQNIPYVIFTGSEAVCDVNAEGILHKPCPLPEFSSYLNQCLSVVKRSGATGG